MPRWYARPTSCRTGARARLRPRSRRARAAPSRTAPSSPMPRARPWARRRVSSGAYRLPPAIAWPPVRSLAQDDRAPVGTRQAAPRHEQRAKWRTEAVRSAAGPTMMPGVSTRESTGSSKASQSCRNASRLVAAVASIAPAEMYRVVRDHTDRPAVDAARARSRSPRRSRGAARGPSPRRSGSR